MSWKRVGCLLAVLAGTAFAARPACAQIGGADLPDLSGLAGAIEKSVQAPPKPASGTVYSSGLSVPSVRPGEGAKALVRQLRQTMEKNGKANPAMQKLEEGMPATLAKFEAYMVAHGFAKRDFGNALGVFFVENWKTATQRSLSDAAEAGAVRSVSAAAAGTYKARFAAMTPGSREKTYETLLSSTMILSEFAKAFDKAGKPQDAAGMRRAAGALFTKVVGTAPSQVQISANGRISGPGTASASPSPAVHPSTAALPPGRPGAGVSQSQIFGIYCQPAYGTGAGGGVAVSYEPVLALKDGTYCGGFEVPPSEFDAAASRRRHPEQWGRWRGSGANIQTEKSGGGWEKSGWLGPLPPAEPEHKLSGKFTCTSGGGNTAVGGGTAIIFETSYFFSPDGRFRSGSDMGASSVNPGAGVYAARSGKTSGTYKISGYGITLRFADGAVQRCSYARTADGLLLLAGKAYYTDN